MKLNNKGFTLIELLAIIFILGILMVIIVINVQGVLVDSKKSILTDSSRSLVKAFNEYYLKTSIKNNFYGCMYDFTSEENSCDFSFDGRKPSSGRVYIDEYGNINGGFIFDDDLFQVCDGEICDIDSNEIGQVYAFDYTGDEQVFTVSQSGLYEIEVWGAQGGSTSSSRGGYGGYSKGVIMLFRDDKLYINVGGQGENDGVKKPLGGYNGGGNGYRKDNPSVSAGGGATHVSFKSGLLSELHNYIDKIIIVAGGGSGGYYYSVNYVGNSGGGYIGGYKSSVNEAGTQNSGYAFGIASDDIFSYSTSTNHSGGGGGFYGGFSKWDGMAGGGSGYIGNNLLDNKVMYCYKCSESDDYSTKTISVSTSSDVATSLTPKKGNGFVRITYLGESN